MLNYKANIVDFFVLLHVLLYIFIYIYKYRCISTYNALQTKLKNIKTTPNKSSV